MSDIAVGLQALALFKCVAFEPASLDAEGVRLLDGQQQLLVEQLRRGVGGQVEAVEAGVGARQGLGAAPALDAEAAGARGAAQRREALVRDGRGARHELHQPQPLLVGEPARNHSLTRIQLNATKRYSHMAWTSGHILNIHYNRQVGY